MSTVEITEEQQQAIANIAEHLAPVEPLAVKASEAGQAIADRLSQ